MSDDLIEQTEAALAEGVNPADYLLIKRLLAALKAERAENERLKQKLYNLGTACDTCGMIHCRCA